MQVKEEQHKGHKHAPVDHGKWSVKVKETDKDAQAKESGLRAVACTTDSVLIASAPVVKVWQLAEDKLQESAKLRVGLLGASSVEVSETGNVALVVGRDGSIGIWDLRENKRTETQAFAEDVFATSAKFLRGEQEIAWTSSLNSIHTLDLRSGSTQAYGSDPEGRLAKRRRTQDDLPPPFTFSTSRPDRETVFNFGVSPDGSWIGCGRGSGIVSLFEVAHSKWTGDIRTHVGQADTQSSCWRKAPGKKGAVESTAVRAVCFDATSSFLASGGDDGKIAVIDIREASGSSSSSAGPRAKFVHSAAAHAKQVSSMAMCPCRTAEAHDIQSMLVSTDLGGTVKLWDIHHQTPFQSFQEHSLAALASAFAPNGKFFVTVGADAALALFTRQAPE
mmetsp:Transcript_61299/g.145958  ORF Transcript_61299/g.145958 Transcript_61299/m.145958 type:complete len:390 (+) Transcript_61299:91-1260(+)